MRSRRDFIKLATSAGAWAAFQTFGSSSVQAAKLSPPRYYLLILLSGGHDTIYTTDPKTRSEVKPGIHIPEHNDIKEAQKLRLGTHLAPLAPYADQLAILNGVQVATANHDTGFMQYSRLKTNVDVRMPSVLDVIGMHRDTQPIPVAYLNVSHRVLHSPSYFGSADEFYFGPVDLFEQTQAATPEERVLLARSLHRHAKSLEARGTSEATSATVDHLNQAAAWFERTATVEPLEVQSVATDYVSQSMAESMQRALWLIENDLTSGIFVDAGLLGWDTHINNEPRQAEMTYNFVTHFRYLLRELGRRKNRFGNLADNTAIIVGSDLGRFPMLNDMLGKDHLPQTAFLFLGKWFERGQAFGKTGAQMEALPISVATGRPAKKGGRRPILDDVGATLLSVAGLQPERFGYNGTVLDFLLA